MEPILCFNDFRLQVKVKVFPTAFLVVGRAEGGSGGSGGQGHNI